MHSVAFCSQSPWLWNGSIGDNIVGSHPRDVAWLDRVIWACGLHEDLSQSPHRIDTVVGSDGTALSGGQKNRICLARAVYSRAQLVIVDDVLSGLDTHTEKLVFNRVFDGLLKELGSTVILATHSIGWLRYADSVLTLEDGKISFHGIPEPVQTVSSTLDNLFTRRPSVAKSIMRFENSGVQITPSSNNTAHPTVGNHTASGSDLRVYKQLFASLGLLPSIFWSSLMISVVGLDILQTLWLKWWASAQASSSDELGLYAGVFAAITSIDVLAITVYFVYMLLSLMPRSKIYLHLRQWTALVNVAFYAWGGKDTGNVINRFSQDVTIVDTQLGNAWVNTTHIFFSCVASSGLLVVATPYIAAALPVLIGVFWVIQSIYLRTSKQLRIMDLEAKAPLCTHFLETISKIMTIVSWKHMH